MFNWNITRTECIIVAVVYVRAVSSVLVPMWLVVIMAPKMELSEGVAHDMVVMAVLSIGAGPCHHRSEDVLGPV